ncbi:MAG: hypothetical protein R2704_15135 [Microthrixaceae bacterium]
MHSLPLPIDLGEFADIAVEAIGRAYDVNASRHEPEVGDDAVVFGMAIYRNSWFLLEQDVAELEGWTSSRPSGSLVIVGAGKRIHVYRCGQDGNVNLDDFRLDDERSSVTKQLLATTNTDQLSFDLGGQSVPALPVVAPQPDVLRELVIMHAGNPDEGCCGIWVGAPLSADEVTESPWAWNEPMWLPTDIALPQAESEPPQDHTPRHDEMPEPEITLMPVPPNANENTDSQ